MTTTDVFEDGNWDADAGTWTWDADISRAVVASVTDGGPSSPYVLTYVGTTGVYGGPNGVLVPASGVPYGFTATTRFEPIAISSAPGQSTTATHTLTMAVDGIFTASYSHTFALTSNAITSDSSTVSLSILGEGDTWSLSYEPETANSIAGLFVRWDPAQQTAELGVSFGISNAGETFTLTGVTGTVAAGTYGDWTCEVGRTWPDPTAGYGIEVGTAFAEVQRPTLFVYETMDCGSVDATGWTETSGAVYGYSYATGDLYDIDLLAETDCACPCGTTCGAATGMSVRGVSIEVCGAAPC